MLSFIFGKGTGVSSPQELSRRREIARALMERRAGQVPKNAWEGLGAIAEAIAYRLENNRLDRAETEGRERATERFKDLFSGGADQHAASPYGIGAAPDAPRGDASQHAGWPGPLNKVKLAEVLSDPWLSEEQRAFAGSIYNPPQQWSPDAEGAIEPQPPKPRPVAGPRQPRNRRYISTTDAGPSGAGLTVDDNGNIIGRP